MASFSMLGPSGQARAPTQALGCGALTGPPGATPVPWKVVAPGASASEVRAAFAAALQQLLGGVAARRAPDEANPQEPVAPLVAEEPTLPAEEDGDGTDTVRSSRVRQGERKDAPAANPENEGVAAAFLPMPPDLIEEAAMHMPAPEPGEAGTGDDMTMAAVSAAGAANEAAEAAVAAGPPGLGGTPPPVTSPAALRPPAEESPPAETSSSPAASPQARAMPPTEAPPPPPAKVDVAPESRDEWRDMPTRSDAPPEGVRDVREAVTEPVPAARAEPEPTGSREAAAVAGTDPTLRHARTAEAQPPRVGLSEAATGEPVGARRPPTRSADAESAPAAAKPAPRSTPAAPSAPAAGRHAGMEPPGHGRQDAPAEGTPAALADGARAMVMHWLQGAEGVDEGEALQHAGRLLLSSLVDDIRRLTFVGQSRAVLQLQPPELGKLSIHLDMGSDGLAIEMVVETEAVRAVVESTLDQLRSSLAQQGLATSGVFVQVGQSAHRDAEAWQARREREVRDRPAVGAPTEGGVPPPQARAVGYGSTVDYRI